MTNGGDWLRNSWEEGNPRGDTMKTVDLVNRTFTIHSVEPVEYHDQKGNDAWDWVGIITLDGEEEAVKAWLGGAGVREQVSEMDRSSRLPQRMTMMMNGRAYELTWPPNTGGKAPPPDGPPPRQASVPQATRASTAPPQTGSSRPESPASGPWAPRQDDTPLQQLGHWLKHHGWSARDAMVALGVKFTDDTVKDDWQTYVNRVGTQSKDLMEAYGKILAELVAWMQQATQAEQAEPQSAEEIPFDPPEALEEIPFE